jgi:uncharacterized membrane protein
MQLPHHRPLLLAAGGFGVVVGAASALVITPPLPRALLIGWCVAVVPWLALATRHMLRASVDDLRRRAAAIDEGRWGVLAGTLAATLASLVAVVWNLAVAPEQGRGSAAALGIATIGLSWLFVHVLFAIHYTHAHWREAVGIVFPGCDQPDFAEFLYFSFTIGMTFQVSDATTESSEIRRLVLVQGIVAFLFNAVIVATAVNLAASLAK